MTNEMKLIVEADRRRSGLNEFWLVLDDVTVAYLKACYEEIEGIPSLFLYDIEVRDEYRGRGLSKEVMSRACEMFNVKKLSHTGGYTSLGYERVFGNVDYVGDPDTMDTSYAPMTFIENWDKRWAKF